MTEDSLVGGPGMQSISSLSLEQHEGPYEQWPSLTRLFLDGRDTQQKVPGYLIEGQYRCDAGYLLILSQDCPFEESCDGLLLDEQFNTLARTGLGAPYCSFLLNTHWPLSATSLRLHFYGDHFYDLHIETAQLFGTPMPRPLIGGVLQKLRQLIGLISQDQRSSVMPIATDLCLRLKASDEFRSDPKCVAAIQELEARLDRIRAATAARTS
jgi:hypothetical protein